MYFSLDAFIRYGTLCLLNALNKSMDGGAALDTNIGSHCNNNKLQLYVNWRRLHFEGSFFFEEPSLIIIYVLEEQAEALSSLSKWLARLKHLVTWDFWLLAVVRVCTKNT